MKRRGVFKKLRMTKDEGRITKGGEFYCPVWEGYIDRNVCIVRDTRNYCAFEAACPKKEAA